MAWARLSAFLACVAAASCNQSAWSGSSIPKQGGQAGGDTGPSPDNAARVSHLRINEVMTTNTSTLSDETGAFPPWLELYNPTDGVVDLSGVALSDDPLAAGKWSFPAGPASLMPARGYLVVFCDGRSSGGSSLHAPFTLRPGPLELVLNNGSDLFLADGSAAQPDQSRGRFPDGGEGISLLSAPTPGAANAEPAPQVQSNRGDVDGDGNISLSDATNLLGYLFQGSFAISCEPVADANDDGLVDLGDAIRILTFLFMGGQPLHDLRAEQVEECAPNGAPVVSPRALYHAYPGHPVEFRIEATDPEGDRLRFWAIDPPPGATLEEESGVVRWIPGAEQRGPYYLAFVVSDEAAPPNRVAGRLVFQVHPLDGCARPLCDPAGGCEIGLAPIGEECCGSPGARVSDPEVGCPDGKDLQVGRNPLISPSIGRLVNCDLLHLVPLGQGGYIVRLNLETRCLAPTGVLLEVRLETAGVVFFEESARRDFEPRGDGYFLLRNLRFIAEGFKVGMKDAQLTVAVTDSEGVRVERKLRLVLTLDSLPDLP